MSRLRLGDSGKKVLRDPTEQPLTRHLGRSLQDGELVMTNGKDAERTKDVAGIYDCCGLNRFQVLVTSVSGIPWIAQRLPLVRTSRL
ncbi:hypothetical protein CMUS01_02080 [Colletotrichum musicola]|uniref:Uncharacterized protein n=1 Tax=Colletotrichum musicola TaxID=2175873 RepID=A0A8H6NVR9_9PEZI|nr:hypothetical protein CMUS01_02080 [Colletotrichum musicola]